MERSDKFNRFNYIVVQNQLRKEVLTKAGVHADKIVVLGSARYCSEWMKQNNQIIPYRLKPHKDPAKKLKVVFMTSKPQCRMDISRMKDTLTMLSKMKNTEVMIKPHTRIGEEGPIFKDLKLPLATDVLSAELCEWADVLLVVASSIITEVLVRGKPALYLKYLHENTTLFEELNACWTIHDESELNQALQVLQSQKAALPYAVRDVDNFLSENIFGGKDEKDVLADYEKFIVNCAVH
jgi:UDP-N-acetylglucosamine:LPS N-acetylglucosamine transferase